MGNFIFLLTIALCICGSSSSWAKDPKLKEDLTLPAIPEKFEQFLTQAITEEQKEALRKWILEEVQKAKATNPNVEIQQVHLPLSQDMIAKLVDGDEENSTFELGNRVVLTLTRYMLNEKVIYMGIIAAASKNEALAVLPVAELGAPVAMVGAAVSGYWQFFNKQLQWFLETNFVSDRFLKLDRSALRTSVNAVESLSKWLAVELTFVTPLKLAALYFGLVPDPDLWKEAGGVLVTAVSGLWAAAGWDLAVAKETRAFKRGQTPFWKRLYQGISDFVTLGISAFNVGLQTAQLNGWEGATELMGWMGAAGLVAWGATILHRWGDTTCSNELLPKLVPLDTNLAKPLPEQGEAVKMTGS